MEIKDVIWKGLKALSIDHGNCRMVILSDFGPRIAFWGKKTGENLLFWDSENRGRKEWKLRGGHRVWLTTPGADESEMTYSPDNETCSVEQGEKGLRIWGALDKTNMTRRGIGIEAGEGDRLYVTSLGENAGDMLLSCGLWALTCTLPEEGSSYEFPLGDGSGWDTFKSVQFRKWGPCEGRFGDEQFQISRDKLRVKPAGIQAKQMFCIPKGEGLMLNKKRPNFRKKAVYERQACYPEGCNWALYIGPDNFMVEMETMGPFTTLKPGEILEHGELWSLEDN